MVVCLAYRHSLGIVILVPMKEKKIVLHCKNQLTGKWSIQQIREIFVTLVLVRSRKYFLTPVVFFIKDLVDVKAYLHFSCLGFICAVVIQLTFCECIKANQEPEYLPGLMF